MQNKRIYETISTLFFLIGAFLIINEQVNITGAVIGLSGQSGFSAILGFSLIICSLFSLLLAEESGVVESLEHKVKYDPNIKSFRRWLEKDLGKKFSYVQAEETYREIEKKYINSVNKESIKHPEKYKTLKFIEDYIEVNPV